jgi:hypothetical protein
VAAEQQREDPNSADPPPLRHLKETSPRTHGTRGEHMCATVPLESHPFPNRLNRGGWARRTVRSGNKKNGEQRRGCGTTSTNKTRAAVDIARPVHLPLRPRLPALLCLALPCELPLLCFVPAAVGSRLCSGWSSAAQGPSQGTPHREAEGRRKKRRRVCSRPPMDCSTEAHFGWSTGLQHRRRLGGKTQTPNQLQTTQQEGGTQDTQARGIWSTLE